MPEADERPCWSEYSLGDFDAVADMILEAVLLA